MNTPALVALKSQCRGVSLGIMAADQGHLRLAARQTAAWGCKILHFDVMDGVFVPAMTAGPANVKALNNGQLRDVHLMINAPFTHVASYVAAGADMITVHAEASDAGAAITAIRTAADTADRPVLAGLALMPGTSLPQVADLLGLSPDLILILSLDPRSNTPPDITTACDRVAELRRIAPHAVLAFDGGVTLETLPEIAAAAPDMIVSGSAVFGAKNPQSAFETMTRAC
ncbi:MAG: ribulose phosphate epimerase [Rhodobacteraceae bacterium]|nr:ribulose phosphate epimerase [Paracoccaceae bacterium]